MPYAQKNGGTASSDIGEVSAVVPLVELGVATRPLGTVAHHWAQTACAAHPIGYKGMMVAAKVLAAAGWISSAIRRRWPRRRQSSPRRPRESPTSRRWPRTRNRKPLAKLALVRDEAKLEAWSRLVTRPRGLAGKLWSLVDRTARRGADARTEEGRLDLHGLVIPEPQWSRGPVVGGNVLRRIVRSSPPARICPPARCAQSSNT